MKPSHRCLFGTQPFYAPQMCFVASAIYKGEVGNTEKGHYLMVKNEVVEVLCRLGPKNETETTQSKQASGC